MTAWMTNQADFQGRIAKKHVDDIPRPNTPFGRNESWLLWRRAVFSGSRQVPDTSGKQTDEI